MQFQYSISLKKIKRERNEWRTQRPGSSAKAPKGLGTTPGVSLMLSDDMHPFSIRAQQGTALNRPRSAENVTSWCVYGSRPSLWTLWIHKRIYPDLADRIYLPASFPPHALSRAAWMEDRGAGPPVPPVPLRDAPRRSMMHCSRSRGSHGEVLRLGSRPNGSKRNFL